MSGVEEKSFEEVASWVTYNSHLQKESFMNVFMDLEKSKKCLGGYKWNSHFQEVNSEGIFPRNNRTESSIEGLK